MTVLEGELGGRYALGELLAVGGQGAVHAATDLRDGAAVVVKVSLVPGLGSAHAAALRLAGLASDATAGPHLLVVWDMGWWGDRSFAVLARMEQTLGQAIEAGVPTDDAVGALLRAVVALERAGVVHGDLKSSNAFYSADDSGGVVLLGDVWACQGDPPISPGFAAPELWRGESPTPATDRYALGCTLWACLAGGPPSCAFAGGSARGPTAADFAASGIGRRWHPMLRALLDPHPGRRPSAAQVLAFHQGIAPRARSRAPLAFALIGISLALGWGLVWRLGPHPLRCPDGFDLDGDLCTAADGASVAWIGPGRFVAGAQSAEERRWAVDAPPWSVSLTEGLWVRTTEVTQGEYRALLGVNPVEFRSETLPDGSVVPCATWEGHAAVGDDLPVACVSWYDAVRFANEASVRDGLQPAYAFGPESVDPAVRWDRSANGWRLPTEAEWEWAARAAGRDQAWAGGSDRDGICGWANSRDQSAPELWGSEVPCEDGSPVLAPVGTYRPNGAGLHDLIGNVGEWVWDRYGDRTAPDAVDPQGPEAGGYRVYRGGGWNQIARPVCARYGGDPTEYGLNAGFRLVRSAGSRPRPSGAG